jgi:hypothetical protein
MKSCVLGSLAILLSATYVNAQADADVIKPILSEQLQSQQLAIFRLQEFLEKKVPTLPAHTSAEQWTAEAQRTRQYLLNDIVFHGRPKE